MGEFRALVKKNYILYKRGCFGNILEFVIPIFFSAFVILVSILTPPEVYAETSYVTGSSNYVSQINYLNSY